MDRTAPELIEALAAELRRRGWPAKAAGALDRLLPALGDDPVEHHDVGVTDRDDADDDEGAPDSTATVVVFTSSRVVVQTIDCDWARRRITSLVEVVRREDLRSLHSLAEDHLPPSPWLRRLDDAVGRRSRRLTGVVNRCVDRHPWLARWYDPRDEAGPGPVVVDLRYRGLRGGVLELPLADDPLARTRLARFLPSLTADLA